MHTLVPGLQRVKFNKYSSFIDSIKSRIKTGKNETNDMGNVTLGKATATL